MKKKLLTMAMALGFAFLGGTTAMAAEPQEQPNGIANYVVEEEEPGLYKIYEPEEGTAMWGADDGLTKLSAPAWTKWDHSDVEGTATWATVEEAEGRYNGAVYKDNVQVSSIIYSNFSSGHDILAQDIEGWGSGTYYFQVCARGDGTANSNSDYTVSDAFSYTQPAQSLGLVPNLRWNSETPAVAEWDAVENAGGYYMELFCDGKRVMGWRSYNDDFLNCDVSREMTEEGDYTFRVKALSDKINTIKSGEYSDLSPAYKTADTVAIINNKLDEALEKAAENPDEIRSLLSDMGRTNLQIAMQTNTTARDKVQQLEEAYANHNNIQVSNNVSSELDGKFDSSKIKVIGTALNAKSSDTNMSLNFSQPQQEIFLDDDVYKDTVQIDISLEGASDSQYLLVPMTMTVPIPEGISTSRFQVIHCHQDGTKEIISPLIINKEERTATFTVLSFSTFVFANEAGEGFDDVDPNAYYATPVNWAVEKGITTGTSATTFEPDANCTRGQIVTFLWRAAGCPAPSSTSNPFADVKSDAYYYNAVLWAVEKGITTGTGATTFSPDDTCTRGQAVTFLYRYAGKPSIGEVSNPFADVKSGTYYYDPVFWALNQGITNGTSATTFEPDANCTRGQIVTFLYRQAN